LRTVFTSSPLDRSRVELLAQQLAWNVQPVLEAFERKLMPSATAASNAVKSPPGVRTAVVGGWMASDGSGTAGAADGGNVLTLRLDGSATQQQQQQGQTAPSAAMVQAAGDAAAQRRSRRKSLTMEADPEFSRAAPFINTSAASSSSSAYTVSSPVAAGGLRVSSSAAAAASAARQREDADSELYSLTPNSAAAHSHSTRVATARNDRSGSVSSTSSSSGAHSARRPVSSAVSSQRDLHSPSAASVADPPPPRPRVLHTVSRHRRPDDSSDGSTCSDMSEGENLRSPPRGSSAMTRTRGASAPAPSGFDSKASIRSLLRDAAASGALGKGVAAAGGPAVHLSLAKQLEQLAEEDSD
jgi:hypothetical protein